MPTSERGPHLARVLAAYEPVSAREAADVERVRQLATGADPWTRSAPLHVTGSAVILHPESGRVLLRWHERMQAWLQVGGHADPDETDPFQIALRERSFQMLDLLIGLTQMMVEGELLQLERIGSINVTEADCMELVDRKTACLFSVCARLGGLAGHADALTLDKLGEYAWNLGMAFQLVDDVLDFTAREKTLGKPVGGDLREGKVTLPLVYALECATPEERGLVETILADRNYERVPFNRILALLEKYSGIERVKERAQAFTDKARRTMGEFPESPYQRALLAVTDLIIERDH
jgi:geranylgeranyl pyrophosphate synthase